MPLPVRTAGVAAVVASLMSLGVARAQCRYWQEVSSLSFPQGRAGHAMVYDSIRKVMVLVGGSVRTADGFAVTGDTWEWNGINWNLVAVIGPEPRVGHAMAFDAARGETVLFGGADGEGHLLADTWTWNGLTWQPKSSSPVTPAFRQRHAMAYDSKNDRVVLFGGAIPGNANSGDTWLWNGTNWALVNAGNPPLTPSVLNGHAMAYNASRERVTLYGVGANGGETWEWDTPSQTWTLVRTDGTPASALLRPAMAYDAGAGVVRRFGGLGPSGVTFEWSNTALAWDVLTTAGPSPRSDAVMAFDAERRVMIMFGGTSPLDDIFTPYPDTWQLASIPEDTIYVNRAFGGTQELGTAQQPFKTVGAANDVACDGATIIVRAGMYPETLRMSKTVHVVASGGPVSIGQ